jgi:hypothetical protein
VTCTVNGLYTDKITIPRNEKSTAAPAATVGATIGVNLNGTINTGNSSSIIGLGAISANQINSILLYGNFNVSSAAMGPRMTMDSQSIKIYDGDGTGTPRVILGNLSA